MMIAATQSVTSSHILGPHANALLMGPAGFDVALSIYGTRIPLGQHATILRIGEEFCWSAGGCSLTTLRSGLEDRTESGRHFYLGHFAYQLSAIPDDMYTSAVASVAQSIGLCCETSGRSSFQDLTAGHVGYLRFLTRIGLGDFGTFMQIGGRLALAGRTEEARTYYLRAGHMNLKHAHAAIKSAHALSQSGDYIGAGGQLVLGKIFAQLAANVFARQGDLQTKAEIGRLIMATEARLQHSLDLAVGRTAPRSRQI